MPYAITDSIVPLYSILSVYCLTGLLHRVTEVLMGFQVCLVKRDTG